MRSEKFSADALVHLLRSRVIATMDELKEALGSPVDMTVFRKLRMLPYLASYSHRGKYYALKQSADFDEHGLWTHRGVRFSHFGSLIDTLEAFVLRADSGCIAGELASQLGVEVKQPLLKLVRASRLVRQEVGGVYLYCAPDPNRRREQLLCRRLPTVGDRAFSPVRESATDSDEAKAAVVLFMTLLDEQQRRLFAGLESLRLGRGGDRSVAQATGLDPHTIAKGRQELLAHDVLVDRRRRPGAGRKSVEKKLQRSSPRSKS